MSFSDIGSSNAKNSSSRLQANAQNGVDSAISHLGDSLQRLQVTSLSFLSQRFRIDENNESNTHIAVLFFTFQKNCLSLKEKVSEMRKKQSVNLAGKKDLDRQVVEMKDFENRLKNQVRSIISQLLPSSITQALSNFLIHSMY